MTFDVEIASVDAGPRAAISAAATPADPAGVIPAAPAKARAARAGAQPEPIGHNLTDVNWDVDGDRSDDTLRRRTDIHYLLA
jgi:hypothetical protein